MATYFKYAERNVDSQINWSEVGKNVVDMLREEDRLREEKKAAIDEASRQFGETLANAPTGDFKSANEWILGYASDASQARLMQDRLLKNGMLKVKDYTIMRQNLNDGTNQMFQVAKEYQDKAAEAMRRYQAGESQDTEAWLMEQVQGLSNFKNTKAYINPTNFTVSLAGMTKKIVDGKEVMVMEENPDKYMTVNQLRNRMNVKLDRFDYVGAVDREVNALGDFQEADITKVAGLYKMAEIRQVLDPTNRTRLSDEAKKTITAYQEWETKMIGAQLSNEYNQLSILTNALDRVPGTQDFYEPTFDAELAKTNKKYILLEDDGTGLPKPKFTTEQTEAATEFLRAQTRNALDRKVSIQAASEQQPYPMQQWQYEAGQEGNKDKEIANLIGTLYYGNANDVDAALEYFRDSIPNAKKVTRTDDGVVVLFNNGEVRDASFKNEDGSIKSLQMFIKGAGPLLAGQADINTALKRGGYRKGAQLSTLGSERMREVTGGKTTTNATVQQQANGYLQRSFSPSLFNQTESVAVPKIQNIIAPLGFKAEESGAGSYVTITAPDGKTEREFSLNDGEGKSREVMDEILKWMQGQYSTDKLTNALQSGVFIVPENTPPKPAPKPKPKPAPGKGKYD
jgi:hypothetical protein